MSLKTNTMEFGERLVDEMTAPQRRRIREIQAAVAAECDEARGVPAKLVVLQGHKTLAVEARDALSDSRLNNAPLALREMINSCLQRASVLIDHLDNGGKKATKVVESIDNLTWPRVKDWAPESF